MRLPIKELLWKELRSNAAALMTGTVAFAVWLFWQTDWNTVVGQMDYGAYQNTRCILATTEGATLYALIAGGFACVYGVSAAWTESSGKHWHFLLFRPIPRRSLMAFKMIVGSGLSSVISLLPLVIYFWWVQLPGSMLAPFDPSYYLPSFGVWIWTPVMFLAALLSGLREARWWFSKFWPVLSVVFVAFFVWFMPTVEPLEFSYSIVLTTASWLLSCIACVVSILQVAEEQDFS